MQKIVISKPGFNVLTETAPNNLIFSSDYNTLKYGVSGTVNINYVTNNGVRIDQYEATVSFNANFPPAIFAYVRDDSYFGTGLYLPLPYHTQSLARVEDFSYHWDKNTVYFKITVGNALAIGSPVNRTATIKYFIFKNDTGILP